MGRRRSRGPLARVRAGTVVRAAAVGLVAIGLVGCSTGSPPAHATDQATGFPRGVFSKELTDPELGRVRLEWVFGDGGRWAELPFPLDGQPQIGPVVRGTYAVNGDELTIATDWPPHWGTSTHRWRLDGDDLWTVFRSSDIPEDQAWFEAIDTRPWRPVR